MKKIRTCGLTNPEIGETIFFNERFERYALYQAIFESSRTRILILGRKNRKLFDKEYAWFFSGLRSRIESGFEFKCLFLDPDADEHILKSAHEDEDFPDQLVRCINTARNVFSKSEIPIEGILKKYHLQRSFSLLIIDDVVLYAPIEHSAHGIARKLTRVPFTMTTIHTSLGKTMIKNFFSVWGNAIDV